MQLGHRQPGNAAGYKFCIGMQQGYFFVKRQTSKEAVDFILQRGIRQPGPELWERKNRTRRQAENE